MHSKRGKEVAFSSHYKPLKVELPEVDRSSKTKCLGNLEKKKLGFHPTQVASTGVKQESSFFSQSWSKSSKSPRSQSFDRPIMKSTHKRWGGNAPSRSSRHTKFVWSSQMVASIVAWSTSTQPWSIQTRSLPYTWCTILFLNQSSMVKYVPHTCRKGACVLTGFCCLLLVDRLDLLELALSMPPHWPVSSNVSLKHFPPWKNL